MIDSIGLDITADFDRTAPVLIVRRGNYVIHHGAVAIARSLGRLGVPVYAIVEDRCTPLALSRYIRRAFFWKNPSGPPESAIHDLHSIAGELGCRPILVPTDDVAAMLLAENQADLVSSCIFPRLDPSLPRRLCNKKEVYKLCRANQLPVPQTAFPESIADVHAFIERAVFPVVIKAIESQRLPKGASSTAIAETPERLIALYRLADNHVSPNLMLQEYIPRGSEDWVFHGYRNPETDCLVAFTGRKLRSWPPFAGPTTLGVCIQNDELTAQVKVLLQAINFAGIMDLDYRLDKRDGLYKLLDFNPRIGANFRMFTDRAQLDVARALHLDLTGRKVRQELPEEGHTLLVESFDFFASLGYMKQGALTPRAWWRSIKGKKEMAWLTSDDMLPFFVMWMRLLMRFAGSALRRGRQRLARASL
jgi:D-aspartate ligase